MHHHTDPGWSSEGFLRAATGPLAPRFQAVLPDYQDLETLQHSADVEAVETWVNRVSDSLTDRQKRVEDFYKFSDEQRAAADKVLKLRRDQLSRWFKDNEADIATAIHERKRLAKSETEPSAEAVPYQKQRIAEKRAALNAQVRNWLEQVRGAEQDFHRELDQLRTPEQIALGTLPQQKPQLKTIDTVMTYGILAIGACLILGLFTRVACVLGAAFLVSVVLTQPFWVSDAQPTFNQWVEMFALLTLATTQVGKWAGLDFFVSLLFGGRSGSSQATQTT